MQVPVPGQGEAGLQHLDSRRDGSEVVEMNGSGHVSILTRRDPWDEVSSGDHRARAHQLRTETSNWFKTEVTSAYIYRRAKERSETIFEGVDDESNRIDCIRCAVSQFVAGAAAAILGNSAGAASAGGVARRPSRMARRQECGRC